MSTRSSNLKSVLNTKNTTEDCVDFVGCSERELMDTPRRKTNPRQSEHRIQVVTRKLFPSPQFGNKEEITIKTDVTVKREPKEMKKGPIQDSKDEIKTAHIIECKERSDNNLQGGKRKVLVSLFTNKEYTMDF